MIIRRRTYIRQFTGRYGYFMRNSTWNENAWYSSDSDDDLLKIQRQFIYTKCMQQEAPVGEFPKAYRNADTVYMNASTTGFSAVGYTDGTTIIVATMKRLFVSTNQGQSWTKVCDLPAHDYYNVYFNPVVYMYTDSSSQKWYCVLRSYKAGATYTGNYVYMESFRYNATTGQSSYSNIFYDYASYQTTSSGQNQAIELHGNYYGAFYGYQPSEKGQICFIRRRFINYIEGGPQDYNSYIVYDFRTDKYSGDITVNKTNAGVTNFMEYTGQWINTDNGYGKFLIQLNNSWQEITKYFIPGKAITYNGVLIYPEAVPATLTTNLPSFNTEYPQNATIFMGFTKKYTNKLFFYASQTSGAGVFYVCDRSFSTVTKVCNLTDEMQEFFGDYTWPCGVYISPDGKWGVYLSEEGNLVFDLQSNSYWGGNKLGAMEGYQTVVIRAQYGGYMLPEITLA